MRLKMPSTLHCFTSRGLISFSTANSVKNFLHVFGSCHVSVCGGLIATVFKDFFKREKEKREVKENKSTKGRLKKRVSQRSFFWGGVR